MPSLADRAVPKSSRSWQSIAKKLRHVAELIRFSHTVFALPFAVLAGVWAVATPSNFTGLAASGWRWLGILVAMVTARSFAMAVNRLADAEFDGNNPRTAGRHLPAGILKRSEVIGFIGISALGFIASCLLFLPNRIPIVLSIPVLAFLAGYSYAKRVTSWVHFWLGAALMLAPVCAWLALRGEEVIISWFDLFPSLLLGIGVLFWVAGFDIIYACQDVEFDRRAKLHSVPAALGVARALALAACLHAVMVLVMFAIPFASPSLGLGWVWHASLIVVSMLLVIEHRSVSSRDLTKVNFAFFQLNAIISVLLLVAGAVDAILV